MFWPQSGRMEITTACPDPPLAARARTDAAGTLYERAAASGDLHPLSGALTPVGAFLGRLRRILSGAKVAAMGADRFRHVELRQHLSDTGIRWPLRWRGEGVRSAEDTAADIRAFQLAVDGGALKVRPNILMIAAIGGSTIVRDAQGRASALKQARQRARIDCLQAAVIACGLGASYKRLKRPLRTYVA